MTLRIAMKTEDKPRSNILSKLFKNDGSLTATAQDPYYKQFKLYLYLFRLFGRIPFEIGLSGKLQVRYFSRIALYSVAVFSLQLYLIYLVYLWQIPRIKKDISFDNVISSLLVLLYLHFHYDILLHSWWEAPAFVAYFESWKSYNVKFMAELGTPLPSRLTTRITLIVLITSVSFACLVFFETEYLLMGLDLYLCWMIFSSAVNVTLLSTFWYFNCLMICHTAEELNNQFVKVLKGNPFRYEVCKYRFLILRLRTLTIELGNVLSRTIVGGILTLFLEIILAMYGFVVISLQEDFEKMLSFIIPLLFGLVNLYIYCEGGYRASNKINHETLKQILGCEFVPLRKEVRQEIDLLLDTIKNTQANIEISGLFAINRNTFVQIIAVIVSYLVVLAQFRMTDKNQ